MKKLIIILLLAALCLIPILGNCYWDPNREAQFLSTWIYRLDSGSLAIDRAYNTGGTNTYIELNNPVNTDGTITQVEIYALNTMYNVEVATFYCTGGNNYSTRDTQSVGNISSGWNDVSVSLDAQEGDYIGIYWTYGAFALDMTGVGTMGLAGDNIPCTDETFQFCSTWRMSICGLGTPSDNSSFDSCIDGLDTPEEICDYMSDNFTWSYPSSHPYDVWKHEHGICGSFANFGRYTARQNGYTAYRMDLCWVGMCHAIAIYDMEQKEDEYDYSSSQYYYPIRAHTFMEIALHCADSFDETLTYYNVIDWYGSSVEEYP